MGRIKQNIICPTFFEKMNKIANIKYIDSFYTYKNEIPDGKLKVHEAFGFFSDSDKDIILEFIMSKDPEVTINGLIIPKCLLVSEYKNNRDKYIENKLIKIHWSDVVYLEHSNRTKSSIFETTGLLLKDLNNSLIIKNPVTTQIKPISSIKHPEKDPTFYVIPKSSIVKYEYV